jgi:hypothetical protein
VKGATVNFGFWTAVEWGSGATTRDDGSFSIDDVPVGPVLVRVDDCGIENPKTLRIPEDGLSRIVVSVEAKGAASQAGLQIGDGIEQASEKPMTEVGRVFGPISAEFAAHDELVVDEGSLPGEGATHDEQRKMLSKLPPSYRRKSTTQSRADRCLHPRRIHPKALQEGPARLRAVGRDERHCPP